MVGINHDEICLSSAESWWSSSHDHSRDATNMGVDEFDQLRRRRRDVKKNIRVTIGCEVRYDTILPSFYYGLWTKVTKAYERESDQLTRIITWSKRCCGFLVGFSRVWCGFITRMFQRLLSDDWPLLSSLCVCHEYRWIKNGRCENIRRKFACETSR